ncbi:MAG: putative 3(2),5-bisphosphate nucleotidase, partial [Acidimicrobiia bacterium]|nr:putative 3(2),5-bisphosphate nucleotidase [Acidimicrobiia bacterium]
MNFESDHQLAARLATETGVLLLELRERLFAQRASSWTVKDAGDELAHEFLMKAFAEFRPEDAVLSEEGHDDRLRLGSSRVWIVDPLDGTNEYSERGRSDWAVHVALTIDGLPVAGAVALPAMDITLATEPAPPYPARHLDRPLRVVTSRSRMPWASMRIAEALGADVVPLGSAGAKAMAVVLGHADLYAHTGGQYEWDNCAPVAVALAAGLHASRIDGTPIPYNQPDVWSPDLLICRPELAATAVAA